MAEINNVKAPMQPDMSSTRGVENGNNRASQAAATAQSSSVETDKVSLSDTLSQLEQTLAEVPVVDTAKVEAIKQSIEDGTYQIDSQELARKMIDFEGDF